MRRLEERLLTADDTWWSGRTPLFVRTMAEVPRALYLNFLARKSYAAALAPGFFRPLDLPGDDEHTLFTILMFSLDHARPMRAPRAFGALSPRVMQSNWRFYGQLMQEGSGPRQGVVFVRTVSTSLLMAGFGRRLARCFPLRRARRLAFDLNNGRATAAIESGGGSAPELVFEGERTQSPEASHALRKRFPNFEDYARWMIDQHLSLVAWPREYIVQDMHLDFQGAKITPLRCMKCSVTDLDGIVNDATKPVDCFVVEGLKVFLDNVYAVKKESGSLKPG